jgi:glutathione S-transferase
MKLIGMLDSPYVRRVAISLQLLGLRFQHQSLSVFRGFDEFRRINPVVKAPTLLCDSGVVLMDSTLILQYAESLAQGSAARRSLMPAGGMALERALHVTGLALAACEKAVQIIYERGLRPADKQHEPWIGRVSLQMVAAFDGLERAYAGAVPAPDSDTLMQSELTTAVAWHFARQMVPEVIDPVRFPALATLSAAAETLAEFKAAPHGDGTYMGR